MRAGGTEMSTTTTTFAGFPSEGLELLAGLAENNTREYFDAHRDIYESALLAPAKAFVVALGEELHARVSPGLRAEPRVNGSILRINRDTRFTTDKRPYKEHLDLWFWEGEGPSREHPGYFIRLRPETVALGAPALKRVPRGFEADHPRAELLRHDALYVGGEWKLPRAVSGPGFVRWVAERLERVAPVERWLSAVLDGER